MALGELHDKFNKNVLALALANNRTYTIQWKQCCNPQK